MLRRVPDLGVLLQLQVAKVGAIVASGIAVAEGVESALLLADLFGDLAEGDFGHFEGIVGELLEMRWWLLLWFFLTRTQLRDSASELYYR